MFEVSVLVRNQEQLQVVRKYPVTMIYSDNLDLVKENPDLYYQVPRVYESLRDLPKNLLIQDFGLFEGSSGKNIVTDYTMNVANTKTMDLFLQKGAKKIVLTVEMNPAEFSFADFMSYPVEVLLYGRVEVMLLKRHPLFQKDGFSIAAEKNKKYPITVDKDRHVHLYHHEAMNHLEDLSFYMEQGVKRFRVDFFEESVKQMEEILQTLFHSLSISC